jgi:hypothetical protein
MFFLAGLALDVLIFAEGLLIGLLDSPLWLVVWSCDKDLIRIT